MFDNPNKELQELENQLLAAEHGVKENNDDFQQIYAEVLAEFGSDDQEPPIRNFANGYGQYVYKPVQKPVEQVLTPSHPPKEPVGFLTFLVCLECLGLLSVAILWLLNQL